MNQKKIAISYVTSVPVIISAEYDLMLYTVPQALAAFLKYNLHESVEVDLPPFNLNELSIHNVDDKPAEAKKYIAQIPAERFRELLEIEQAYLAKQSAAVIVDIPAKPEPLPEEQARVLWADPPEEANLPAIEEKDYKD